MKKFLQKLLKKPLALALALLIVIGSISAAVYALYPGDSGTLKTYIQITKKDGTSVSYENAGTIVENEKTPGYLAVEPGDDIVMNVSIGTEKTAQGKEAKDVSDNTDFAVNTYRVFFRYDPDILQIDMTGASIDSGGNYYSYSGRKDKFVDAKTLLSCMKAVDFSGDYTTLVDSDQDGVVEVPSARDGETIKFYSYIVSVVNVNSEKKLNPTGATADADSGKDVIQLHFKVKDDIDVTALDTNGKLKELPINVLTEAYRNLIGNKENEDLYPGYIGSPDCDDSNTDSSTIYLTTEEYAESLSFTTGTVNFDTNNSAYNGLGTGTISTTGYNETTTGSGVYTANGIADAAIKAPVVTPTDTTNLTFAGWSTEEGKTSVDAVVYAADGTLCEGKTAVTYNSTNPTTLYAVYTTSGAYTLKVNDGKGNEDSVQTKEVQFGTDIKDILQAPSAREGYTFSGWDNNIETAITRATEDKTSEVTNAVFDSALVEAAKNNTTEPNTVSTTAIWTANMHYVYYLDANGTKLDNSTVTTSYNATDYKQEPTVTDLTIPFGSSADEDNLWKYYKANADGTPNMDAEYKGTNMPDYDLIAVPTVTKDELKVTVNYHNEDTVAGTAATASTTKTYKLGDKIELDVSGIAKTGYTFAGLDLTGDNSAEYSNSTISVEINENFAQTYFYANQADDPDDGPAIWKLKDGGLTIDLLWTANTYTINFTYGDAPADSGLTANATIPNYSFTYKYGQKLSDVNGSIPAYPSYIDKASSETISATGWGLTIDETKALPITEENNRTITVPAQWTPVYKITFNPDNGSAAVIKQLKENEDIVAPTGLTKTGYTFEGWYVTGDNNQNVVTIPAKMGTSELSYTAKWSKNQYKLTYVVDEKETSTDVYYNEPVKVDNLPTKTGYTYASVWTVDEGLNGNTVAAGAEFNMPANNVKLSIKSTVNTHKFTISYGEYQGKQDVVQENVPYGTAISNTVTDADTWSEHKLTGWKIMVGDTQVSELPATMPDADVTVTALYGQLYKLTYDYDNSNVTPTETYELLENDSLTAPTVANPTKAGYDFAGWRYFQGDIQLNEKPSTMPAATVKAVAQWTAHTNTVTYGDENTEWNDGSEKGPKTLTFDYNQTVGKPTALPVKDGYTFLGWDINGDGDYDEDDNIVKMPDNGFTVKPIFEAKEVVTTIKDGDNEVYNGTVKFDTSIDKDGTIKPAGEEGKEEGKWYVRNDDGTKTEIDLKKPLDGQISYRSPLTIEAIYTVTDKYYIANGVDKDGNFTYEATPVKTVNDETGTTYAVPGAEVAVSEKYADAFEFKGWAAKANDTEVLSLRGALGDTSNNYYAVYDLKEYTVTFLNEDGTVYDQKTYKYGAEIDQPDDPEKLGYTFQYWNDADGKKVDDYGVMPAKNLTFSPYFMSNDVSATFMKKKVVGDEYVTYETVKETVGEAIKTPDGTNSYNPFKLGYKFTGWADENGKSIDEYTEMPNGSMTFYAQYELDETAIALTVGGVVVSGAVVGTALAANAALITTGAVVGGVAVVAGAAALAKHTHKVTYYVDGEVYKTYYCVEGTKVLTPDDPSKDGYTFAGWDNEIPEKMPANDLEFNATWSGNVDDEIPDTGSATAGLAAFAVISSAAAAAYVLTKKKKDEE